MIRSLIIRTIELLSLIAYLFFIFSEEQRLFNSSQLLLKIQLNTKTQTLELSGVLF